MLLMGMPDVSPAGTLEITPRLLCQRLNGLGKEQLMQMIEQLSPHLVWFPAHNTLWIRGFYDHQNLCRDGRDGNYRTGAHRAVMNQHADIRTAILLEYPLLSEPYSKGVGGSRSPSKPLVSPSTKTVSPLAKTVRGSEGIEGTLHEGSESVSESGTETGSVIEELSQGVKTQKVSNARFEIPALDAIREYLLTLGGQYEPNEAENFCDYWTSVAWMRRGIKMKDWKATARMHHRDRQPGGRYYIEPKPAAPCRYGQGRPLTMEEEISLRLSTMPQSLKDLCDPEDEEAIAA